MNRVVGRTDDMLIIKGVNVFPAQIESVLCAVEGTQTHYRLIVDRDNNEDKPTVMVEVVAGIFFDAMEKQRTLA